MNTSQYKAAIWDMDGTLLNTLEDIAGALNQTLRAWGFPEHTPNETLDGIGHGSHYLCHWGSGLEGEKLEQFTAQYRATSINLTNPKTKPYPGIVDLLHHLKDRNIRLGIYTNKPQLWTEQLVHRHFGDELFDIIIGTTPNGYLKPDSGGIDEMCQRWGLQIDEVVMIGDSDVDWQTAANAHCRCICVSWGFGNKEKLRQLGASIVNTADELRDAVVGV